MLGGENPLLARLGKNLLPMGKEPTRIEQPKGLPTY